MHRISRSILRHGLFAALLALAPAALAQPMGPPPCGPGGHGGPGGHDGPGEVGQYLMLAHKVGLSDSQEQQIRALLDANRSSIEPLLAQVRSGHQALDAKLYRQTTPSASDLAAWATQLAQVHAQLDAADLELVLKIRALLTPDQIAAVDGLHDKLESLRQQTDEILRPSQASSGTAPAAVP